MHCRSPRGRCYREFARRRKLMTKRTLLLMGAIILALTPARSISAQSTVKLYRQMSPTEQAVFVQERSRKLTRQISAGEYNVTTAFEMEIQKYIDSYLRHIGKNPSDRQGTSEPRVAYHRGSALAPKLIATFKAQSVSPLIGLY